MEDVRKFWLENQDGKIIQFTDEESKTFLSSPSGLGIDVNYGGFRLGNSRVVNYQQYQLDDISGTLLFYGNSRAEVYQKYFEFTNFISKNILLKLHYQTPNSFDSFYRYVFVRSLKKEEIIKESLVLECPIVFATQTFWRSDNINSLVVSNEYVGDSKRYPLKRPYSYASSSLNNMRVFNRGNAEASLKIVINGSSVNPTINAFDNKGVKYGEARFIGAFDQVVIDSEDLGENIQLIKNGAYLVAPYSYQDLSIGSPNEVYVTFIKLKSGESTLTFTSDSDFDGTVELYWSDSYVSI